MSRDRGLTQKQLGELSGLAQSTIARFETGSVAEFGARKLLRLLEILGHELAFKPKSASFTLDDALAERLRLEAAVGKEPKWSRDL
ncbi:helix-turn-helix domain-containing protein [Aquabacterium sp. CECT 9606]|uniref:helix-turn-helix domain-containing protein n=1 Tax=Aquabacterium sp. CECT 9606 TaxID=2845822 RepID=UPI0035301B1F